MKRVRTGHLQLLFRVNVLLWGAFISEMRAVDFFELEPTLYSQSQAKNAVEQLKLKDGFEDGVRSERSLLEKVLRYLNVPISSQVLVYSKTSLQRGLISMASPRAIYFNDTTYVGYVRGGDIEIAIHDENLGMAFYLIRPPRIIDQKPIIERPDSCLNCHVSRRTNDIPGVFVRSVSVDEVTQQIRAGSFDTTHTSPYSERWGGWFVTGDWDENEHLGNTLAIRNITKDTRGLSELSFLKDVYLRKTSDIVALTVLEHQCTVHNALITAKLRYERAWFLYQAIEPEAVEGDRESSAWRVANSLSEDIVQKLLFYGEATMLGDGLSGSAEFVEDFENAKVKEGGIIGLRELRGVGRLFKYRCSYMIGSPAFEALPDIVKQQVLVHLKDALLTKTSEFSEHLTDKERQAIGQILEEMGIW